MPKYKQQPIIRLLNKIEVSSNKYYNNSYCWIWLGSKVPKYKYGTFHDGNRLTYSHIYSYKYFNFINEIPKDKEIDHLCNNKECINPLHLELTDRWNNIKKGKKKQIDKNIKIHISANNLTFTISNELIINRLNTNMLFY